MPKKRASAIDENVAFAMLATTTDAARARVIETAMESESTRRQISEAVGSILHGALEKVYSDAKPPAVVVVRAEGYTLMDIHAEAASEGHHADNP